MRITKVDRCGAEIEKCPEMKIRVDLIRERRGSCFQSNRLDLCQKCEDELYDFIFTKGEEEKNVEQTQSQDPEQENLQKTDV